MSIGMNIALIVALALAATGISTQHQAGVSNSSTGGRGQNLNHNETMVSDTAPGQPTDNWMTSEQSFTSRLFTLFSLYRAGAGCSKWVCGANHNETLVRDTTTSLRAEDPAPLTSEQSFTSRLFTLFSLYRAGAGCSKWVCGSNHNETLVRETELKTIGAVTCPK